MRSGYLGKRPKVVCLGEYILRRKIMKLDILKDKRIIGILIAVILIIIVIVFINVNRGNSLNDKVSDTFSSKGSLLLFVYDSSDSESMYKEINKELKNRKIE